MRFYLTTITYPDENCGICKGPLDSNVMQHDTKGAGQSTPAERGHHAFHAKCLEEWFAAKSSCPECGEAHELFFREKVVIHVRYNCLPRNWKEVATLAVGASIGFIPRILLVDEPYQRFDLVHLVASAVVSSVVTSTLDMITPNNPRLATTRIVTNGLCSGLSAGYGSWIHLCYNGYFNDTFSTYIYPLLTQTHRIRAWF